MIRVIAEYAMRCAPDIDQAVTSLSAHAEHGYIPVCGVAFTIGPATVFVLTYPYVQKLL
jgi:hypothetical protein